MIEQQFQQLQTDKQTLVTKLNEKGVTASNGETFTTLCPKVGDIQGGGGESGYDYFEQTLVSKSGDTMSLPLMNIIKKIPKLTFSGTNLSYSFCYTNIEEIDFSDFNTSNVTNMSYMFASSKKLISLDLSGFDTSNVQRMQAMFNYCIGLTSLDLSSFDTSKVITMQNMFSQCNALTSIDLSSFNTSNVTNMQEMFYGCTNLASLDLSSFNTSKVTSMNNMFRYSRKLSKIIINNEQLFKLSSVSALYDTPISSGDGYVYVPDDMVDTYKSATNWSSYAGKIKPLSELPTEEV